MSILNTILSTQYLAGFSAILNVVASAQCFGWVTPIMNYLLDPGSDMHMTSAQAAFMVAVIEFGELIACVPSGIMADKFGRKWSLLISGPMYAVGWLVVILTKNYIVICAMRILQGFALGLTFTVVPLYLGEISSPSQRGSITSLFSMAWFFGYLVEYIVGPFVSYFVFTTFTAVVPVLFTVIFFFQPESPYYLLTKGKEEEATKALKWLRKGFNEDTVRSELEEMKESIKMELSSKPSWNDVIALPEDRRALLIILLIGGTRILSGAVALMSYSTNLFSDTGPSFLSPDVLTIIMGFAFVIGSIVNSCVVDSIGRRPLIILSCFGSCITLLLVGSYFFIKQHTTVDISSYSWVVPVGVIVYCLFSVVGIYPITMTYTSELFTTKTRGKAASLSTINLTVGAFLCIELYQFVGDNIGLYAAFWFFALVCFSGGVSLYILAPETKGKTFSEIRNSIFNARKTKTIVLEIDNKPKPGTKVVEYNNRV